MTSADMTSIIFVGMICLTIVAVTWIKSNKK